MIQLINSSKHKKVLTNIKPKRIMKPVSKLSERTTMAKSKTKKLIAKLLNPRAVKSVAWLIEASFRAFIGWILISNFNQFLTVAAGLYALATAGAIVVYHFFSANKK